MHKVGAKSDGEGQRLLHGRYRLGRLLGQGGMAKVYKAHDEFLGRDVAVKMFRSHTVAANDLRRQKSEITVLAGLNHHSLVTLLDVAVDKTVPREPRIFFVLELVEGIDLKERLAAGPLSARHVAQIGCDLAEGLEFVHNRGIVHRDIKPANILMVKYHDGDKAARAKLTDFGIAMRPGATHITAENAVTGSVAYLSPEQALGEPMGTSSDIYSFGLVLLECFTGVMEYPGAAVVSAVARLIRPPHIPASLSPGWHEILSAMTARDPGDRPSASDLVKALRQRVSAESGKHAVRLTAPSFGRALRAAAAPAERSVLDASDARAERARLEAVRRYDLLDTPPDRIFDRITAMAARVFGVAVATVSVVDSDRVWFKSRHGLEVQQVARVEGLCASAILHDAPWIVQDARADPRALANPLVAGETGMQFYAGVPLTTHDGFNLGALSVMDRSPRTVTADEISTLTDLAAMVMRELDLRRSGQRLARA